MQTRGAIYHHTQLVFHFFIPAGKTFFKKDTWVQLYELYEFTPDEIDNNKEITVGGSLNVKMIDDIVNCLFLSEEDNIAGIHKGLLRPPLQDSLLKLKDKFNKNRKRRCVCVRPI